jgi:hypothetical protein
VADAAQCLVGAKPVDHRDADEGLASDRPWVIGVIMTRGLADCAVKPAAARLRLPFPVRLRRCGRGTHRARRRSSYPPLINSEAIGSFGL